ncbi:hypothetical protein RhiirA1_429405 [Rhizophagus irregularis]|uniref:Uncharacterized protein n=1 Tax=Rhizophagus irregularis TaxID=588596 RepID=A0A2N0QXV0_9GLOM|nr:hypothetical protein RhiirA1_429405 [Rhizophagus irregularis]
MSTEKSTSEKVKQSKKSVDRDKSPTLQRLIKELSNFNSFCGRQSVLVKYFLD